MIMIISLWSENIHRHYSPRGSLYDKVNLLMSNGLKHILKTSQDPVHLFGVIYICCSVRT